MKRLRTEEIIFYCWNMSIAELYIPLIVDKGKIGHLDSIAFYERLFINIGESRLYFQDFWEKTGADRRDYLTDEAELMLAKKIKANITKDKKYRKRFFRDAFDFKLIGRNQ